MFHRTDGPAQSHGAKLIRYADDFVVLVRRMDETLKGWIDSKLEVWLGLEINREKIRVVDLRQPDTGLDFLGDTFRLGRDRYGRRLRYWQLEPSAKALARERDTLRNLIHWRQSHTPLPELIGRLNHHMRGWAIYFGLGGSNCFFQVESFPRSVPPFLL